MFRLGDMIKSLATATVPICGTEVTVRGLSAAEHMAIRAQTPDPPPRQSADGKGGTTIDPHHPDTVRLRLQRDTRRSALVAGAATGHAHLSLGAWKPEWGAKEAGVYADDVLGTTGPSVIQQIAQMEEIIGLGLDPQPGRGDAQRIGTDTTQGN